MKKLEKQTLASNKLRLFSIFIAVFLIPMLLMCIMNLWAVHNDTINTASQFTGQLLQQNSTTIDNVLRLIDGSFSQLFMNGDVLDFFQATSLPSTFDEYKGIADIFSEMRSVLDRGNGYVSNIYLYNENTDVLLTSRQSMKYETRHYTRTMRKPSSATVTRAYFSAAKSRRRSKLCPKRLGERPSTPTTQANRGDAKRRTA